LEKQQKGLDQMIAMRQGFLQRTEEQKADIARHLAALAEEARDLRQLMEKVAMAHVQKPRPRGALALRWPVSGIVRKNFGDKDADGVRSEGLTLAAPSGAPVVAPYAGRVVFVGPFRGYGQIMILQHNNGYHSFLSGFGRIDAEMAQEVDAGEPLGVLPVKEGTKPELYFEWRRGDKPVDPLSGLSKGKAAPEALINFKSLP
jgi:murein DD-endopeptidase MepM/ murein hydrolase activator NlpD